METHINIYNYLEDFDNSELKGHDWWEQMRDAVDQYNSDYDDDLGATSAINGYIAWKRSQFQHEL